VYTRPGVTYVTGMAESLSGRVRSDVQLHAGPERLDGQRVAVVGGTGGLGQAIARELAARGAQVTVVGQTFRDAGVQNLSFERADLSSMNEAARIGKLLPGDLDVVVLTTGIFAAPKREETAEGLERDMAVSYLSRLVILRELAPRLKPKARVFVMGFPGTGQKGTLGDLNADTSYDSMVVHMNTVAGNEALVLDAQRRWPHVAFFGLNPGLIKTNIRANVLGGSGSLRFKLVEGLIGLVMMSPEKYAKRTVPVLFAPGLEAKAPVMFNQKAKPIFATPALDEARVKQLISESEVLVERALKPPQPR
jgi:NAD(P)-dependent dehydrogenase (short-subunit alcohol dehydrogenase family)